MSEFDWHPLEKVKFCHIVIFILLNCWILEYNVSSLIQNSIFKKSIIILYMYPAITDFNVIICSLMFHQPSYFSYAENFFFELLSVTSALLYLWRGQCSIIALITKVGSELPSSISCLLFGSSFHSDAYENVSQICVINMITNIVFLSTCCLELLIQSFPVCEDDDIKLSHVPYLPSFKLGCTELSEGKACQVSLTGTVSRFFH